MAEPPGGRARAPDPGCGLRLRSAPGQPPRHRKLGSCRRTREVGGGPAGHWRGGGWCDAGPVRAAAGDPPRPAKSLQLRPRGRGCTDARAALGNLGAGGGSRAAVQSRAPEEVTRPQSWGRHRWRGVVGLGTRGRQALGYGEPAYAGLGAPTRVSLSWGSASRSAVRLQEI